MTDTARKRKATSKQRVANRRNARKSTGLETEDGKGAGSMTCRSKDGAIATQETEPKAIKKFKRVDPKTAEEAEQAVWNAMIVSDGRTAMATGQRIEWLASRWPGALGRKLAKLHRAGAVFGMLAGHGGGSPDRLGRIIQGHRRQIIEELEISSTAEFMLLDAAMDAYLNWMLTSGLTKVALAGGTSTDKSKHQARMSGMAQSHLRTYMDAMKTLAEMKRPPIRVLQVRAGENVAVQVNEQPNKVLEAKDVHRLPEAERRKLPESTPAIAETVAGDPARVLRADSA